jgi:tripartite-type tricarboxylate transporter receptor subunit TctC
MTQYWVPSRRRFLQGSAAIGAAAMANPLGRALAAGYPDRNINVYVPTREGGGADRNLRAFTGVWKKYLNTNFEGAYYPGAAGRVGYEKYMGLAKPDCYDLLFGNMGPEVLNWVVQKPTFDLDDYFYFAQVDSDPGILFVDINSPPIGASRFLGRPGRRPPYRGEAQPDPPVRRQEHARRHRHRGDGPGRAAFGRNRQ